MCLFEPGNELESFHVGHYQVGDEKRKFGRGSEMPQSFFPCSGFDNRVALGLQDFGCTVSQLFIVLRKQDWMSIPRALPTFLSHNPDSNSKACSCSSALCRWGLCLRSGLKAGVRRPSAHARNDPHGETLTRRTPEAFPREGGVLPRPRKQSAATKAPCSGWMVPAEQILAGRFIEILRFGRTGVPVLVIEHSQ